MTTGISVATADSMLDLIGDPYMQMHIGDPGVDGTANIALVTQRMLVDLGPAAGGARSLVGGVEWPLGWPGTSQTVTHLSGWDSATSGNFLFSVMLITHILFVEGMIPSISLLSVTVPSLAAD